LLGQAALNTGQIRLELAAGALAVYEFWYFAFAYTSALLDAITFNKLHELEKELDIVAHRHTRWVSKSKFGNRMRLRQLSWTLLLLLETVAAVYLVYK
jgi:hypothetical protein